MTATMLQRYSFYAKKFELYHTPKWNVEKHFKVEKYYNYAFQKDPSGCEAGEWRINWKVC